MSETVVKSVCRGCHGVCGVNVHLRDGVVVKVTGDKECPTSLGYICAKGRTAPELLYHPDRLKYPLKRVGARGENKWQRISWDEALDRVAAELMSVKQQYGADHIAATHGTGRPYIVFFERFVRSLGTPNFFGGMHICYFPRLATSALTTGILPICDFYGFGGTYPKCVLIWGCNITETGASDGMCGFQLTRTLRRRGTKSIVVDPRRTSVAAGATHWLQVRPGTDAALALAMLHVIIAEGLYDKEFVGKWTVGFEDLSRRVAQFTPEWASTITWVSAEDIRAAAHTYAITKPACIQWGVAIDQGTNNLQTSRAILCLSAITGNLDVPGGDVFFVPPKGIVVQAPRLNPGILGPPLSPEVVDRRMGTGHYPFIDQIQPQEFFDAVVREEPHAIRALFVMGCNIVVAHAYSEKMIDALKKINFTVATDLFMTPTTQLADIVLPAASWLEQDDVADLHFTWCVMARQRVAQIGECRDDKQIIIDLAHRLGLQGDFPWNTVTEWCDWLLKDTGLDFEQFKKLGILKGDMRYRKYEKEGFATPSGMVELRSSTLESMGFDPLPSYVEPPESPYSSPELFKAFPLIMTTGARTEPYFHSEGRQIKSLRRLIPEPFLEIHPETARALGVDDGDRVWVESPRGGRITLKARLTCNMDQRVVSAPHSWWFPEQAPPEYGFRESSVNMLTHGLPFDRHTGSESWRSFLCRVTKAD